MDFNKISAANPKQVNDKIFNQKIRETWLAEKNEPVEWRHEEEEMNNDLPELRPVAY